MGVKKGSVYDALVCVYYGGLYKELKVVTSYPM